MTSERSGIADYRSPNGVTFRPETRFRYLPAEPIPAGWRRGNQSFVSDDLHVFWYDPAVPFEDRKEDGSTHRWVTHRRVTERRARVRLGGRRCLTKARTLPPSVSRARSVARARRLRRNGGYGSTSATRARGAWSGALGAVLPSSESTEIAAILGPPEYDHNADLVPPHFLEPDPTDTTSCKRCGDVNGFGCLHLPETPEFDVDDDFGKAPRCDGCPHFAHRSACDVVVSRWPMRLCPCGGAQCVA